MSQSPSYCYKQSHSTLPSPLERGDDEVPDYPAQCTGLLTLRTSRRSAYVEFFLMHADFADDDKLDGRYAGEGMYVLSHDRIWVITERLTYGIVRAALGRIAEILNASGITDGQNIPLP